jgi:hypothetical protein
VQISNPLPSSYTPGESYHVIDLAKISSEILPSQLQNLFVEICMGFDETMQGIMAAECVLIYLFKCGF